MLEFLFSLKTFAHLFFFVCLSIPFDGITQSSDSAVRVSDSLLHVVTIPVFDSSAIVRGLPKRFHFSGYHISSDSLLQNNKLIHLEARPEEVYQKERETKQTDPRFYVMLGFFFLFGLLRVVFAKYFSNMLKVFFNTSLRQNQLTDQLKQDKLPSLLFNLNFIMVGGVYVYMLLSYFEKIGMEEYRYVVVGSLVIAATYFVKFLCLQLIGWISGTQRDLNNYIFVVFLNNKLLAVFLLPLMTAIAFSNETLKDIAVIISLVLVFLLLLLRYLRGYNLIQHSLKFSKFHFFIYVISVELMPLFLIYRFAFNFLTKSL